MNAGKGQWNIQKDSEPTPKHSELSEKGSEASRKDSKQTITGLNAMFL